MAVSQKFLFSILYLSAIVLLIITYLIPKTPNLTIGFALAAMLIDLLAFSTKYYTPFFVPFMKMSKKTVVLDSEEAFVMAPSRNAIIVRKEGDIFASAFVKIPTYRSGSEMSPEEKIDFSRLFSRVLSISRKPVKFSAQLYVINKDSFINNITIKLNQAEERYQNMTVDKEVSKAESERVRGEVTMWHNLLENVNKVKSHALEAFAMTTAYGGNEEEAISIALQQADEIAVGVSSVFGITATIVEGDELLRFIEPDAMIPLVTISEQMRERVAPG